MPCQSAPPAQVKRTESGSYSSTFDGHWDSTQEASCKQNLLAGFGWDSRRVMVHYSAGQHLTLPKERGMQPGCRSVRRWLPELDSMILLMCSLLIPGAAACSAVPQLEADVS